MSAALVSATIASSSRSSSGSAVAARLRGIASGSSQANNPSTGSAEGTRSMARAKVAATLQSDSIPGRCLLNIAVSRRL